MKVTLLLSATFSSLGCICGRLDGGEMWSIISVKIFANGASQP